MSHLECFQQARREDGFAIRKEEYAGTYLGMDERSWAATLLTRRDGTCGQASHARIIERKAALFRNHTGTRTAALFPWVTGFVERAAEQYRLAIAAGGRRGQIRSALAGHPIEPAFDLIASADECAVGRPDPAIYESALRQLNANRAKPALLRGAECLAIEDSSSQDFSRLF